MSENETGIITISELNPSPRSSTAGNLRSAKNENRTYFLRGKLRSERRTASGYLAEQCSRLWGLYNGTIQFWESDCSFRASFFFSFSTSFLCSIY